MLLWRREFSRAAIEENQMDEFRNVLIAWDLKDLDYMGSPFTWCNRREGANKIYEILNIGIANSEQRLMFLNSSVSHGTIESSDHFPIHLTSKKVQQRSSGRRPFRLVSMWVEEKGCKEIIENIWLIEGLKDLSCPC